MKILFKISLIIIFLSSFNVKTSTGLYDQHFISLNNTEINLSQYQGKKMLLVNMASESIYASTQIPQLEQLYQQYKDSLVVIGFFSNDFNNETRTDSDLRLLMENTYHISFPSSKRIGVKDNLSTIHPLYKWLQNETENGVMSIKVNGDFQKFLIDTQGNIIGVFSGKTKPLDNEITNAITQ